MSHGQVKTPYLLIPVETRVREFHAKLLLSCVAVEAGFSVVLGWTKHFKNYAAYLPRGIVVERTVAAGKLKDFSQFRRLGNHLVAWCEEGLVTLDPDVYVRQRVSAEVLGLTDTFFAWGPQQAHMIATRIPDSGPKMVLSGNVRFDLLREPYRGVFSGEVNQLKARYSPFILINTNFGYYNHALGREAAFDKLKKNSRIRSRDDADFFRQWFDYVGEKFHHFVAMVAHLSASFPHYTILVRPHPSENVARWQQDTRSLANVQVVHDGNVVPWLLAAEVVIHNSCTTGVEAYVAGTPVVAYRPVTSEQFDSSLPNEISKQVTSLAALQATLQDVLTHPHAFAQQQQTDPHARQILQQYVADIEGPFATEQIVSTLLHEAQQNARATHGYVHAARNRMMLRSAGFINAVWKDTMRPMIQGRTYGEYKFPAISVEEVEKIIADLRKVSGRFEGVQVRSAGLKNLFHLQQA